MKLLYLSCHEILEYDELRLLHDLGHEVYSHGAYTFPAGDDGRKRPGLPDLPYDAQLQELMVRYGKTELIPQMLDGIDAVIVMHTPEFVLSNWDVFRIYIANGGRVIWRSIGQSTQQVEQKLAIPRMQGMEMVRYSPREETIPGYLGSDALIRFAKYEDDFKPWVGDDERILTFSQHLTRRADHCGGIIYASVTGSYPSVLYGPGNEDWSNWGGLLSYEDQLDALQHARVYLYTGTFPASYTLSFMEALIAGVPVVAVGPGFGNAPKNMYNQNTYEVHELIQHEVSGFIADDLIGLRGWCERLLVNPELAKQVSVAGRARAVELFGHEAVGKQWTELLER